jgi:peptidyl-tRNA hydrolase, PTH1 family
MSNRNILIIGLGNPGPKYQYTRHNVGFEYVDALSDALGFSEYSTKFSGLIASKIISSNKIFLLKPQTYMNLSGECVSKAVHFYKIDLDEIFVIHDDLDLELGKVKMKKGGGAGGHNGLKSIDQHIGKDYHRIRIGIGKPNNKMDVSNYVLGNFSASEQEVIDNKKKILVENFNFMLDKNYAMLLNKMALT